MKSKKKLIRLIIAAFVILFMMPVITAPKTQAASLKNKNKKAHKVLQTKYTSLYNNSSGISYKYMDVTGDGVHELLASYFPSSKSSGGSMYGLDIFQVKNGKIKCILRTDSYGLAKISYYKSSKSLIMNQLGHGGESYSCFKFRNGKFKSIASKARQSIKGGSVENGPWYYYGSSQNTISKSSFNKKIKGMIKGKAKITKPDKWLHAHNENFTW